MYINLGIIGNPLQHTFSPFIHNYFLYESKMCGGYTCYETSLEQLDDLIDMFVKYNFTGINVTVPYKQEVIKYCTELDITVKEIGAVNTLHFTKNGIIGHNTDIFGFHMMLESNGINTQNKRVLLLGAGGASRAVIPYLLMNKPEYFVIANRTLEKAQDLSLLYDNNADICSLDDLHGLEFDIVINATSMGVKGESYTDYGFKVKEAAVDMIYKPQMTSFLSLYSKDNIKLVNGLAMLIYQAAGSFNIWTGCDIIPDMEYFNKAVYK